MIGRSRTTSTRLRKVWNAWLQDVKNRGKLDDIRRDMDRDAKLLETGDVAGFRDLIRRRALEFKDGLTQKISVPSGITEPNLASVMLLVEEGQRKLLLTGDGAGENIVEGLERVGRLKAGEGIHVNTLKVQHHGATANVKAEFCRRLPRTTTCCVATALTRTPSSRSSSASSTPASTRRSADSQGRRRSLQALVQQQRGRPAPIFGRSTWPRSRSSSPSARPAATDGSPAVPRSRSVVRLRGLTRQVHC